MIKPYTYNNKKPMEFKVGQGLNEDQEKIALQKITQPDFAMESAEANSFFGLVKNTIKEIPGVIKNAFSIREEPVEIRPLFKAETEETTLPPVVTTLSRFGADLIEMVPRAAATWYGEYLAPDRKTGSVNLGVDARRFGFEDSRYATATKSVTDAIEDGEPPVLAALRVFSEKTLDIAFGAQIFAQVARATEKALLRKGLESKIVAWESLGRPASIEEATANKIKQTSQALQNTKNTPLAVREKVVADVNNSLNKSLNLLRRNGLPSTTDTARLGVARRVEVLGRETAVEKKTISELLKPDLNIKTTPLSPTPVAGLLPGTRERPGQAPAFGLSTKEVESVGKSKVDDLAEEAKKYKSAEEFVKAQGVKNTDDLLKENVLPKEIKHITTKYNPSDEWVKVSFNPNEVKYVGNAKMDTVSGYDEMLTKFRKGGDYTTFSRIQEQGKLNPILVDTYKVNEKGVREISILDGLHRNAIAREKNIPIEAYIPKSQLTDIWNKANMGAKSVKNDSFLKNDIVKITDKKTGKSKEVIITNLKPDGLVVMPIDGVGIPNKVPFSRFNVDFVRKGEAPKQGITFKELKELDDLEAPINQTKGEYVPFESSGTYKNIMKKNGEAFDAGFSTQGKGFNFGGAISADEKAAALARSKKIIQEANRKTTENTFPKVEAVERAAQRAKAGEDFGPRIQSAKNAIKHSEAFDIEDAIKNGEVPASKIYKDVEKKTLTPEFAKGRVNDVAEKLDEFESGLGEAYKDSIKGQDLTMDKIVNTGEEFLEAIEKTDRQLAEIDKLIVKGDVRVVRRGNKDVYQIKHKKKDGSIVWLNARDEDSAVKKLTTEPKKPTPKIYTEKDQQKIDFNNAMLENVRERLAEHPARPLLKFIDKKEGQFLDFKNPDLANNNFERQRIIAKNTKIIKTAENAFADKPELSDKFDDPDSIRDVIEDYLRERQVEKSLIQTKKQLRETLVAIKNTSLEGSKKDPLQISPIDTTEGEGRSIEILANQALNILDQGIDGINVSLHKIIENTVTPVKKKVNIIDTYLRTPHFVMEKIGFGNEAKMLRKGSDLYWKELPKNIEKVSQWLTRLKTKESQEAVFDWLDGQAITLAPVEKKVAIEIKDWLKEWAVRLKLPEDNRITHYITHIFGDDIIEKEFPEELARIITDKIPKETFNPFLLEREGVKGYKRDLGLALDAYVKRATRKVHMDPALEAIRDKAGVQLEFTNLEKSQFKYIQKYIENIQMRPTEIDEGIDNFIKSIIGYKFGQRPVTRILRFFRQATFRGMLGLNPTSALRNLSQGVNTYAELGEKYTALGYLKLFSKGSGEELLREGVLNAGFVEDRVLSSSKKLLQKADKVLFSFFNTAEKVNRGAAYFGAKSKALSEGKTIEEAIEYAKKVVGKTQFNYDAIDTPVGMGSDIAKTLLQFQTYTTKQLEFLLGKVKGSVKGEEKLKNIKGLIRYALAGMAFVYTVGKVFNMKPQELLPFYRFDTPPSLKFPTESVKAILDAPDKYGQDRTLEQKLSDVGKSAIGLLPAGNQIKKTLEGLQAVEDGGSFDKGGKLQFKQGQSILEKVQTIMFGKYASKDARDYFNRDKIKKKEQEPIRKIYDQVQEMKAKNGGEMTPEAQAIVDSLSDADYEVYKQIRSSEKAKATIQGKKDMLPVYLDIQRMKEDNNGEVPPEAQVILDEMTDEEYKYYRLIKEQYEKL